MVISSAGFFRGFGLIVGAPVVPATILAQVQASRLGGVTGAGFI